jgi:hypothetical protein
VSEDDRAVMERLAALEAEVKADADAQRARKDAALVKLREQRAEQQAESDAMRSRQRARSTDLVSTKDRRAARDEDDADVLAGDLSGALELAKKAHGVKRELARKPKQGDKSWVKSGVASTLLGPLGWMYAGSLREAVPASAAWLVFAALASKLFLLMPVLLIMMPLSGIAGVVYALQYNRHGSRQRLFDKDKKKQLPGG